MHQLIGSGSVCGWRTVASPERACASVLPVSKVLTRVRRKAEDSPETREKKYLSMSVFSCCPDAFFLPARQYCCIVCSTCINSVFSQQWKWWVWWWWTFISVHKCITKQACLPFTSCSTALASRTGWARLTHYVCTFSFFLSHTPVFMQMEPYKPWILQR